MGRHIRLGVIDDNTGLGYIGNMFVKRNCETCSKRFEFRDMPSRVGRGRFCSRACKVLWTKGKHFSPETELKTGNTPWNLGLPPKGNMGFQKGTNIRNTGRTRFRPGQNMEEDNYNWKDDDVGYTALHDWVRGRLGKPRVCENCNSTKNMDWANISGEYRRELDDWVSLCHSCHFSYDGVGYKGWATRNAK